MLERPRPKFRCGTKFQPIFRELGIDAEVIFRDPRIKVWRKLPERQNCTLDATLHDGRNIRWHIKRYEPALGFTTPADDEARGHQALAVEQIPTAELVGWGNLLDRRSFVIFDDLTGFQPADKAVEAGLPFDRILTATADLSAKLHRVGLHHRDLYLCHFLIKPEGEALDVRLIDSARVKRLPGFLTRKRWIVKDLAQFWYSTTSLPITDEQRTAWLARYAEQTKLGSTISLRRKIERKVGWIARHDAELHRRQPTRNISIPTS